MCGIAGYCGEFDKLWLQTAVKLLAHRGPDDSGIWIDDSGKIGFAHTRLSIIDLSIAGHQPMTDSTGQFVIVYNGEIYNFKDIRSELESKGAVFRSQTDTEVLLEAFVLYGENVLSKLNGIFAFAIWNKKEKSLFIARDALGVKPLYYATLKNGFAFASEIKALLPLLENKTIDIQSIYRYIAFLWCPGEGTPIKEVRKLSPGEAIIAQDGKIKRKWKWYKIPSNLNKSLSYLKEKDAIYKVRESLRKAVHRQLISDVPVGSFLSGGVDSSSIVFMAREKIPDLKCFTIKLEGGQDAGFEDDFFYAQMAAKHLGVQLEIINVDADRMANDFEKMVWTLDEPLADPAPLNVLYISKLARDNGVPVVLSGAGGDDIFTGYPRHIALKYERLWSWIPLSVRKKILNFSELLPGSNPLVRRFHKIMRPFEYNGDERLSSYFYWIRGQKINKIFSHEVNNELNSSIICEPIIKFLEELPKNLSPLERMLALEQRFFLGDHNLLYTDKMSMAVGVEVRVPYLDLELVELSYKIPENLKLRGICLKWILKKSMEQYLPKEIIKRPKTGFGAPVRRWLKKELQEMVSDLLSPDCIKKRGIFNPEMVNQLIHENKKGKMDYAYTILSLMAIELWFRIFVDGHSISI